MISDAHVNGGLEMHLVRTQHYVPSFEVDGIEAGAIAEVPYGRGAEPYSYMHYRFVVDDKQGIQLAIGYNELHSCYEAVYLH